MLVSVIITNFNYSKFLNECLDSVLNQTYTNLEIIIIDDYSSDNSRQIINEYFFSYDNIIAVYNIVNMGVIYSRNLGIDISKGDFVCFLDADDYWNCNKIKRQVNYCVNFDLSFSDLFLVDEHGLIIGESVQKSNSINFNFSLLNKYNFIPHSSLFIRKSFLTDIHYKSIQLNNFIRFLMKLFFVKNLIHEDYDFLLRIFLHKNPRVIYLDEKLVYYRKHRNSFSAGLNKKFLSVFLIFHKSLKYNLFISIFFTIRLTFYTLLKKTVYYDV